MNRLKDKVAIITGAGRGIGREICLYLASEGARIIVNDLGGDRDGSGEGKVADQVVEEIKSSSGEAVANYDSVGTVEGGQNIFNTAIRCSNETYPSVTLTRFVLPPGLGFTRSLAQHL